MHEPSVPVFGPAMGRINDQFVMMIPLRKSTVGRFSIEAIETAVEIMLVDALPPGLEIDSMKPQEKIWSEEYLNAPGTEQQVLVRMAAFVKEANDGA